ncbi:MAG TPA: glycosyltransferase [Solirubrobacteraceae bacterium]|jgi:hypothetical protein
MRDQRAVDVLIVSLGSTAGLRAADEELRASLQRAGAVVELVRADAPDPVRSLMLTDLAWARAARTAQTRALSRLDGAGPGCVIYSSTTAALLWRRPGAIRFDAPSAGNRPGRHGFWQRPLERRRLAQAPLLLPWSGGGRDEAPLGGARERALVVPVPVEASGPSGGARDVAAITYAANPYKKGLDRVLSAWRTRRHRLDDAEELLVAGAGADDLARSGIDLTQHEDVRLVGPLASAEYRALLRRSRVFVCAPRREDYGLAQLEALADGCQLVTTPSPGPYAALPIARTLDPRLVSDDLATALEAALESPLDDYSFRAREALAPFGRGAVDSVVAEQLLPRLLG